MRLALQNTGAQPVSGLVLRARLFRPEQESDGLRVLDFTVRSSSSSDEWKIPGAQLVLEWPAEDGCAFAVGGPAEFARPISITDLTVEDSGEAVAPFDSWNSEGPDGVVVLQEFPLPTVQPNTTLSLVGGVSVAKVDDGAHQIHGAAVRFKHEGSDEEFEAVGEAAVGDTLEVLISLHNGSCVQGDPSVNVRTFTRAEPGRGVVKVGARTHDPIGFYHPRSTKMSDATINIEGGVDARLSPLSGTTVLWQADCTRPVEIADLPDWIFQGGVDVNVPGFIPRMTCETHARYVTTQVLVERAE
ncbi:hypothetical protein [Mumia flava]|nr:hypothetical protein [Mumia flava]